ncbi:MAG: hypothetical protein QXH55_02865 [Candidatus Korarchaeota archaeon]|nr:hypothetical protein [Thermoproteota archaeon]
MRDNLSGLSKAALLLGLSYVLYIALVIAGEMHFEDTYNEFLHGEQTSSSVINSFLVLTFLLLLGLLALLLAFSLFLRRTETTFDILSWRGSRNILRALRIFYVVDTLATIAVVAILVPENIKALEKALVEGLEITSFSSILTGFFMYFNGVLFGVTSLVVSIIMLELQDKIGFFKFLGKAYWLYFIASAIYLIEKFVPTMLSIILYPLSCLIIRIRMSKLATALTRQI